MARGNPLVAAKEKGNKLANKAKDKGKIMEPKAKKQTKDKGKKNDVSFVELYVNMHVMQYLLLGV